MYRCILFNAVLFLLFVRISPLRAQDGVKTGSTADLSGVWLVETFRPAFFPDGGAPLQNWALTKFKEANPKTNDPNLACLPEGMPRTMFVPLPMEILQLPSRVVIIHEGVQVLRQIYLNRDHPQEVDPSFAGDSIGKWDGDTLVVDTIGVKETTWVDSAGLPHSDVMHVVERIRRLNDDTLVADFFGGDEARLQDYLKFRDGLAGLKTPTRISDVIASGLDQYDAVFVPGGHGPMMDLLDDPDAGTVMRHFHKTSKPTAVLCHGPISLLSALPNSLEFVAALATGEADAARAKAQGWIYAGYKMTIFSTVEEKQREPQEIGGKVLFYPDFALRTAGGDVSVAAPWKSYVLQDRELISGQNPFSDEALLKLLLPALSGKKSEGARASSAGSSLR